MEETKVQRMPMLQEQAPSFKAITTQGEINFPDDYRGKWVVLFSHPADFTPVCSTEFLMFSKEFPVFRSMNTELLGLSIDSNASHIAWVDSLKNIVWNGIHDSEVPFPVIEDSSMEIAKKYGMLQETASNTDTVRAVFIIDPAGIVRAILYYPLTNGRNIDEIIRLVQALQVSDKEHVATPANWRPGDDVIMPNPRTIEGVTRRMEKQGDDYYCLDWYLCFKKHTMDFDKHESTVPDHRAQNKQPMTGEPIRKQSNVQPNLSQEGVTVQPMRTRAALPSTPAQPNPVIPVLGRRTPISEEPQINPHVNIYDIAMYENGNNTQTTPPPANDAPNNASQNNAPQNSTSPRIEPPKMNTSAQPAFQQPPRITQPINPPGITTNSGRFVQSCSDQPVFASFPQMQPFPSPIESSHKIGIRF